MALTPDDKERGYWRCILLDGRYQHNDDRCTKCDFLWLAAEASEYYRIPVHTIGWKHLGFSWTCSHPQVRLSVPTESQILHHARAPEFSFLHTVELRARASQ